MIAPVDYGPNPPDNKAWCPLSGFYLSAK